MRIEDNFPQNSSHFSFSDGNFGYTVHDEPIEEDEEDIGEGYEEEEEYEEKGEAEEEKENDRETGSKFLKTLKSKIKPKLLQY